MWSGERSVRFAGEHYRLDGVKPGPEPAHPIEVWLGVNGPRALELLGRAADGWVPSSSYVPPDELAARHARIDDAASAAGRDPRTIRRVYNVFGVLTGASGPSRGFLQGPVDRWVDDLVEVVLGGRMDTVVVATSRGPEAAMPPVRQVEVLAAEVAPAVRAAVADELG
jgi:alkanesulfonate monooxygenase SsuD/methylene tetrahydromethanopterin reductase-like flavin-dependent oxidoreductase (luciferase family)